MARVSHTLIGNVRSKLPAVESSTRVGIDGIERRIPVRQPSISMSASAPNETVIANEPTLKAADQPEACLDRPLATVASGTTEAVAHAHAPKIPEGIEIWEPVKSILDATTHGLSPSEYEDFATRLSDYAEDLRQKVKAARQVNGPC